MSDEQLQCPVCGSDRTERFVERRAVATQQNLLVSDTQSARALNRGMLFLRHCRECGFVYNAMFDSSLLAYGATYDNTQTHSPYFQQYVDELVARLINEHEVRDCTIVEVGCGKGGFLRQLVEHPAANNRGVGFDPAYVGPEVDHDGRLRFERRLYDEAAAHVRPDVVVCRHVIEHVPQPLALLRAVRRAIGEEHDAKVFFETPDVRWILRHGVIWDFFYEHCSLFTAASLSSAFARAGFEVASVRHAFGEQYLWLEAGPARGKVEAHDDAGDIAELAGRFAAAEAVHTARAKDLLARLAADGSVALWGAGAKGATFANLVDTDAHLIDCVVDVTPSKQGRRIPGVGHPIIAPRQLSEKGVKSVVVLNPNYVDEIRRTIAQTAPQVQVVDLMAHLLRPQNGTQA